MAFGDEAESLNVARTVTDSTTYVTAGTLTTSNLSGGDYFVHYTLSYQTSDSAGDVQVRLLVDGATEFLPTERLQEYDPGIDPDTNSHDGTMNFGEIALAAGVHTFELQLRRVGGSGGDDVVIDNAHIAFFKLDPGVLSYNEARNTTRQVIFTTTYQLYLSSGVLSLPAGRYRIMCRSDSQQLQGSSNMFYRFRQRRDPAGANTITLLFGANSGDATEVGYNLSAGASSTSPYYSNGWVQSCVDLEADDYEYEIHWREDFGDDVALDNAAIVVMQLPP